MVKLLISRQSGVYLRIARNIYNFTHFHFVHTAQFTHISYWRHSLNVKNTDCTLCVRRTLGGQSSSSKKETSEIGKCENAHDTFVRRSCTPNRRRIKNATTPTKEHLRFRLFIIRFTFFAYVRLHACVSKSRWCCFHRRATNTNVFRVPTRHIRAFDFRLFVRFCFVLFLVFIVCTLRTNTVPFLRVRKPASVHILCLHKCIK